MPQMNRMTNGFANVKPLKRESDGTINESLYSIDISFVSLLVLQFFYIFVGFIDAFAALFPHDFAQRRIHILGHSARVAAHEEICAFLINPFPNLMGVLRHSMLDIDLLGLIA